MPHLCLKLEITVTSATFILALNYQMCMMKYTVTGMDVRATWLLFLQKNFCITELPHCKYCHLEQSQHILYGVQGFAGSALAQINSRLPGVQQYYHILERLGLIWQSEKLYLYVNLCAHIHIYMHAYDMPIYTNIYYNA